MKTGFGRNTKAWNTSKLLNGIKHLWEWGIIYSTTAVLRATKDVKEVLSESAGIAIKRMLYKRSCYFNVHAKLNL